MTESQSLWLIPILPLIGAALNGFLGRRLPKTVVSAVAVLTVLGSFLWVMKSLSALGDLATPHSEHYFTWIQSGSLEIGVDFMVDRLTSVMLMIVTGVGLLIHIYAVGYMDHEEGFARFFSYLNLFMFFMLTLVLARNFLLVFVGWEGVGLASYLLIGFYLKEKFAGDAGKKAFIVNRIGDFGFSLAMFLMVITFGSLDFTNVFEAAAKMPVEAHAGILTAIALLLFVGACGKSAQVPLYVWLPDAMAGPTPVSALIHAATMVTAGVYIVARSSVIFDHAPIALDVVSYIGLLTAVVAATIGMTQYDIKKVFAYSTVSQLGFMFMACGAQAYSSGIFHVATHAFFKALLFLGAGSVIHALHGEQDMRQMGGLRTKIPQTFWTLCFAWLAISGVPGFSGALSKDEILIAVHGKSEWMFWVGVITAGITAFYVSRAMFMTFFGEYRGKAHPHESPVSMTGPLWILALLSAGGGYLMRDLVHSIGPEAAHGDHGSLEFIIVAAGLIGIAAAAFVYLFNQGLSQSISRALGPVYRLVYDKYRVDEFYDAAFVRPIQAGSSGVLWRGLDNLLIDGIVNGAGRTSSAMGGILRRLQGGNVTAYATWIVLGAALAVIGFQLVGGNQ
jgi:NADH-quinone oxidoreductase subunit L